MSVLTDAKLILTPNGYKAGKLYSLKPFDGTGDFDVVRATTAWRRNAAGIWESVSANVPRLHYPVGGGCPSVLVEPQRTNLLLRSQEFDNASWAKLSGASIIPNATISPDGTTTADSLVTDGTSAFPQIRQIITVGIGTTYNLSCFVKKGTNDFFTMRGISSPSDVRITFNLNTLTLTSVGSATNVKYTDEGNGWYKISFSMVAGGVSLFFTLYPTNLSSAQLGNQIIWQAQLEEGSTATSIIPTTSATVTRNEDVIDVTTPAGVTEIVETFSDGSTNTETTIPATYQLPQGEIKSIVAT
jgi:hypothetical protein